MVSASAFLHGFRKDVAGEVVLEDQDILVASAGLSDIEEIEVQELRDTSGVNLVTEWARNPWSHSQTECIRGRSEQTL